LTDTPIAPLERDLDRVRTDFVAFEATVERMARDEKGVP
jgi:hypothetical protein